MNSPFGNLDDAATHLARAELLFDLDRFDEAREELGGALSADPAHVGSLTLLAILELQVGKHDDALTAASAALAAEPTHDTARLARGHALALLHRTQEALDVAAEIADRYPESWWHNVHYALIVRESRNGQDALDAAWVAVRLAGEDARTHLTLARVAVDLGLTDLAERALAAAERLDPGVAATLTGDLGPRLLRGSAAKAYRGHANNAADGWGDTTVTKPKRPPFPEPVRKLLRVAAGLGIAIPALAAWISGGQENTARIVAGLGAIGGIVALVMLFQRLPESLREELRVLIDTDKALGLAVALAVCGPLLAGIYAATGMLFLLAIATIAGFGALLLTVLRGRLTGYARRVELGGREDRGDPRTFYSALHFSTNLSAEPWSLSASVSAPPWRSPLSPELTLSASSAKSSAAFFRSASEMFLASSRSSLVYFCRVFSSPPTLPAILVMVSPTVAQSTAPWMRLQPENNATASVEAAPNVATRLVKDFTNGSFKSREVEAQG